MRFATPGDRPIIEAILAEAGASGETMIMGDSSLEWFFDNGFFLVSEGGEGCFWLRVLDEQTLEVHATYKPSARGRVARQIAKDGIREVFSSLPTQRLITRCKTKHKHVIMFGEWLGFRRVGTMGDDVVMECTLDTFVANDGILMERVMDAGFPLPLPCTLGQAIYAGFFLECLEHGQVFKGVDVYNRMGSLLGWEPLLISGNDPMLFSVGTRQFSPIKVETEA